MNPYKALPDTAFWRLAVASKNMFDIDELWNPKFNIQPKDKIVTFGSCFAQHIGKALKHRGYTWHITEKSPPTFDDKKANFYGYNIFSARTGNIYTTSLLKQWTEWALNKVDPPTEYWEENSRIYDPFRPRIEPNGFGSIEEMEQSRFQTINSFEESIIDADYFVFTLGLTESWKSIYQHEYPMCPGTAAGKYNSSEHNFINQKFMQVLQNLSDTIKMMRTANPTLKFILTVSPVPLTATNSGKHVLVATMASKSILRAVSDQLSNSCDFIDYFPSFEIINSPAFKGIFFQPNQRSVHAYGVNFVMNSFFSCLGNKFNSGDMIKQTSKILHQDESIQVSEIPDDDEHCEEALLDSFGQE